MNIRKTIAGIVACFVVCSCVPAVRGGFSENAITANAEEYRDLKYKVKYDGTIEITGCSEYAVSVEIPSEIEGKKVTSIGISAFESCSWWLTSITIPDSVTSIGSSAFESCDRLTSITIPDSVTYIGDYAFRYCRSLTSITIPDSVTYIGNYTFYDCRSLTSITIPDSVISIGCYAFKLCESLTSITIPDSVKYIDFFAFEDCTLLESITIPDGVKYIGDGVFRGCKSLESITIPNSVTGIGYNAFGICTSLTSITIPDSVTSIGDYAFNNCRSLTSITIPNSVTSIGKDAFYNHPLGSMLESITIKNPNCEIYDSPDTIDSNATIYGYRGSTAQAYAEKYGRKFIEIQEDEEDSVYGDANGDGAVTIADATAIVQFIANPDRYPLDEKAQKNADCYKTGDGVTGLDAYAIQLLEAGTIKSLPYNG